MEVFSDPTGSTLLMVPVYFGEAGPFQFVLDTGASRTVLAPDLADELGLDRGQSAQGQGIESEFDAATIEVEDWRVGDVDLQPRTLITAELPEVPSQGPQFRGLLGSDVLAGFGVVEIDYDQQILTLTSGN
jgi:predicted aspartyl protease